MVIDVMDLVQVSQPSRGVRAVGLMSPALALLMATPFAVAVLTDAGSGPLLLAVPMVLGVVAAPGYLYAFIRWRPMRAYTRPVRWWIRVSLLVALGASLVGAAIGLAFILPSVAAVLTAMSLVVAWSRLEAQPRRVMR